MEVGRVGDLKIREGSIEPPAWSAISCLDGRTKNLSKKERLRLTVPPVGRQSAAWLARPRKNGLTRDGLLMEVARDPAGAGFSTSQSETCIVPNHF